MPTKKPVDDTREPVGELKYTTTNDSEYYENGVKFAAEDLPLARLILSGVAKQTPDGKITWRMGHLLHIANLYRSNPAQTERDYADDLAVARAYSADVWEALLK